MLQTVLIATCSPASGLRMAPVAMRPSLPDFQIRSMAPVDQLPLVSFEK